jgi:hypothetical protein
MDRRTLLGAFVAVEWGQPIFPLVRKLPSGTLTSDIIALDIPVIECAQP